MNVDHLAKLFELLLSWPIVVFIALLFFRRSFTGLLDRIKTVGVGKSGITIDAGSNQSEAEPPKSGLDTEAERKLKAVENINVSPLLQQQEQAIKSDLEKLKLTEDKQKAIDILVKQLAVNQILLHAEYIYRTIYGSQIALLKYLNTCVGAKKSQLMQFYENAKAEFPQLYENYEFEQYISYLQAQNLIAVQNQDQYVITIAGREFLQWMPAASVTECKPF